MRRTDLSIAPLRLEQGQLAAATETYERALAAITKASELDPKKVNYRYDIGVAHEHMGDAGSRQGQIERAMESYGAAEQQLRIAISLTKNAPEDTAKYSNELCVVLMRAAGLRAAKGDLDGAQRAYSNAQEAIVTAIKLNPKEASYRATRSALESVMGGKKPD